MNNIETKGCGNALAVPMTQDPFVLALFRATLGRLKNFKEAMDVDMLRCDVSSVPHHILYLIRFHVLHTELLHLNARPRLTLCMK